LNIKYYLAGFQDFNGGPVAFGGSKGYITSKGKIKTGKLDFEDLPDENQVLLKIPRQNNMYSFNLENIVPSGGLVCLIAKAKIDESAVVNIKQYRYPPNQKNAIEAMVKELLDTSMVRPNHSPFSSRIVRNADFSMRV
ncbi:hypothetical protein Tco_1537851, partial [Tanacetum coccineum]